MLQLHLNKCLSEINPVMNPEKRRRQLRAFKSLPFLVMVIFIFISTSATAQDIHWLNPNGYIPNSSIDSMQFETADEMDNPVADTAGSLAVTAASAGEIVQPMQLPEDFMLSKVHICFAANNTPTGPVTIKIYQDQGALNPLAPLSTDVVFQQDIPEVSASLADCNELMVFDPTDPDNTVIVPTDGSLYLGIGITGADSPMYLKAVGIEEYSDAFEIDGCDTGVDDRLVETEQGMIPLSALIAACEEGPPRNHGQYVKCVSQTTNRLKKNGEISGKEKGKIQKCAAKANIP